MDPNCVINQSRTEGEDFRVGELDHKIGNLLAMFTALIRVTEREAKSVSDFAEKLHRRVMALGSSQRIGLDKQDDLTDLSSIAVAALKPYAGRYGLGAISGDAIDLVGRASAQVAVILGELATNAVKHGALSSAEGWIDLSWRIRDDGYLTIDWIEKNGPTISPPETLGFGTHLVHRVVEIALNGAVDYDYDASGLRVSISIDCAHFQPGQEPEAAAARPGERSEASKILRGRWVLLAEDDPIIALDMIEQLRDLGAEQVRHVTTIESTEEVLRSGGYDVALVDLSLRDGKSDEPLIRLAGLNVVLIAMTGKVGGPIAHGMPPVPYLQKPFTESALIRVLEAVLR